MESWEFIRYTQTLSHLACLKYRTQGQANSSKTSPTSQNSTTAIQHTQDKDITCSQIYLQRDPNVQADHTGLQLEDNTFRNKAASVTPLPAKSDQLTGFWYHPQPVLPFNTCHMKSQLSVMAQHMYRWEVKFKTCQPQGKFVFFSDFVR